MGAELRRDDQYGLRVSQQELRGAGRYPDRRKQHSRSGRRSRSADAFLPETAAIHLQGGRAERLGRESESGMDADFPWAHRRREGMAPARMGAERRRVLRE